MPKLSKQEVTVEAGKSVKVKVLNAGKKVKVKWSVKDKNIATVKKGQITGKSDGVTKVIAMVGKRKLTCKVRVLPAGDVSSPSAIAVPGSEEYEKAMVSGLEEDFYKYFARKSDNYTKSNEEFSHGEMTLIQYESSVVGSMRDAYVYTPASYQEGEKYPVIYMLHGIGCDCTQWKGMGIANILDNMIARNEIKPVVAVFPGIIPKKGVNRDTLSQENIHAFNIFVEEFKKDLKPFIMENYSVSDRREDTGVCGLSMGGMEALELGFSLQDCFNYIGSFSAAPTLDVSLLKYSSEDMRPELVLLCTGTNDTTIGDNPLKYHEELSKNGVQHIWYQYPKGTHSNPVWINGVINFLLRSYAP